MHCPWVVGLCLVSITMCINDLEVGKRVLRNGGPSLHFTSETSLSGTDLGKGDKREY